MRLRGDRRAVGRNPGSARGTSGSFLIAVMSTAASPYMLWYRVDIRDSVTASGMARPRSRIRGNGDFTSPGTWATGLTLRRRPGV